MTLTIVIGSSGSGKTTFLNELRQRHKCIYLRQYHNVRPYLQLSKIPNFDPTKLPYWNLYENVKDTIQVGGTMAGQFVAGLSGGQRKMFLFELICQRVLDVNNKQSKLLIVFDEPFAGVTDDFVPFILNRLLEISAVHNIVLVTNDHINALQALSDNVIRVSAIDRFNVLINNREYVSRDEVLSSLTLGGHYKASSDNNASDLQFFWEVEVKQNATIKAVSVFTFFSFMMFLCSFWGSSEAIVAFVIVGSSMISFFCLFPYLIGLTDWRNAIHEESEALLHSSKYMNKILKFLLSFLIVLVLTMLQYGFVNTVVGGVEGFEYWVAMFFDFLSLTFYLIFFGIYTNLPFEFVQIYGSMPFVLMIFFSTTFSPGSGLPIIKELRYLFPRFYFWCIVPNVENLMEGCPSDEKWNLTYLVVSALWGPVVCIIMKYFILARVNTITANVNMKQKSMLNDLSIQKLQSELFGDRLSYESGDTFQTLSQNTSIVSDDRITETQCGVSCENGAHVESNVYESQSCRLEV